METLSRVATNDITRLKANAQNGDDVQLPEIKKKLMDTIETNQLIQLMKATNKDEKTSVEILNEAGFSIKDVTDGLKQNAEMFKERAEFESQKRVEVENIAKESREQVYDLKEKLLEQTITQQMDKYHSTLLEVVKKLDEKKEEKKADPVSDIANQILMKLLNEKVDDIAAQKSQHPLQSILDSLETIDALKTRFSPPQTEFPMSKDRADLEIVKLKLEDERERWKEDKRLKLDTEKHETIKYAINTIGTEIADSLGAFAAVLGQNRQGNTSANVGAPSDVPVNKEMQGVTYQCSQCQGVFILSGVVQSATCPYCSHSDKVTEN